MLILVELKLVVRHLNEPDGSEFPTSQPGPVAAS